MEFEREQRLRTEDALIRAQDQVRHLESRPPQPTQTKAPSQEIQVQMEDDKEDTPLLLPYQAGHVLSK